MTRYQGKLQPEGILEQWSGSMVRVVLVLGYAVHKISRWSWQANKNGKTGMHHVFLIFNWFLVAGTPTI